MKHVISAALILATSLCFGQASTWSSLRDFGGTGRDLAVSFPIGSKVYVGTGLVQSSAQLDLPSTAKAPGRKSRRSLQRKEFTLQHLR